MKRELDESKGDTEMSNLTDKFDTMSFGMTHNYRIAVDMGANIVRIGTLIFGERDYSR